MPYIFLWLIPLFGESPKGRKFGKLLK